MTPPFVEPVALPPLGSPTLGWFRKSKTSARSCRRRLPPRPTFLKSAMSQSENQGLRRMLRPALPKVPWAGITKAAGLNQKFWSLLTPCENCGLGTLGSPTRFHGWGVDSPTPATSSPRQTERGRPDWK